MRCWYIGGPTLLLLSLAPPPPSQARETQQPAKQESPPAAASQPEDKPQPAEMPSIIAELPDYSGDLWERSHLTGGWGGVRTDLARRGLLFDLDLEQTIQGHGNGGKDLNGAFRYSGSVDFRLKLDTARMQLWPGGLFELHAESKFGDFLNRKVGSQVNDDALFPLPGEPELMLSHVTFTQALSENFAVFVGKLDTTVGDQNEFAWISSKDNFLHTSFRWNPISARTTPYSTLGAGFVILNDWLQWSFTAYDAEGTPSQSGFDTVFDGGTSYATEARFTWKPFDLKGHQLLGLIYSDKQFLTLEQDPRIGFGLPGGLAGRLLRLSRRVDRESGSWAFYYNFDQYVYAETEDPTQGIGVFGRFGLSDGEANPIEAFYSLGLGGKGLIPGRDQDRCGLGYFYTEWSDVPLAHALGVNNAQGVELFYNIEVAPWLHITPDLQVLIDPGGVESRGVAIVGGVRMRMSF
jgi:porin